MHPDEIVVTDDVARELVYAQFPRWSGLRVRRIRTLGTVNAIVRIGDDLAARFPLRRADPAAQPDGSPDFAADLAAFVRSLRGVDTGGARFEGAGRGGDLRAHDRWMETCFVHSAGLLDVPRLRALWSTFRELPRLTPDVMSHGDLIPGNVLVADGRLAGVLDGGGFGPADPALDLVAAWHLLDDGPRSVFREHLGCDDLEWTRGAAWAFEQAMGVVWYYRESNPPMSRMGRTTLGRIIAGR